MVKPKYERTNNGNWSNNSIQVGFKIDERRNYAPNELDYHKKIDLFNIGVNLKTNKYRDFETFQNFQLFDYSILGNLFDNFGMYIKFEAININSNILFDEDYCWFNAGLGFSYEIFNNSEFYLVPILIVEAGYFSYKFDNKTFNNFPDTVRTLPDVNKVTYCLKILSSYKPFSLEFNAEYSLSGKYKKFFYRSYAFKTKLSYMIEQDIEVKWWKNKEKFLEIYLNADYYNFKIKDVPKDLFRFSAGIDIYFTWQDFFYLFGTQIRT